MPPCSSLPLTWRYFPAWQDTTTAIKGTSRRTLSATSFSQVPAPCCPVQYPLWHTIKPDCPLSLPNITLSLLFSSPSPRDFCPTDPSIQHQHPIFITLSRHRSSQTLFSFSTQPKFTQHPPSKRGYPLGRVLILAGCLSSQDHHCATICRQQSYYTTVQLRIQSHYCSARTHCPLSATGFTGSSGEPPLIAARINDGYYGCFPAGDHVWLQLISRYGRCPNTCEVYCIVFHFTAGVRICFTKSCCALNHVTFLCIRLIIASALVWFARTFQGSRISDSGQT
ncbi:hypothetical protein F5B20DRAFT_436364 [Whalleya microplaca]|nr:hypothetical protein F5B20DRAFT_436364 [Whalleya microplaca]